MRTCSIIRHGEQPIGSRRRSPTRCRANGRGGVEHVAPLRWKIRVRPRGCCGGAAPLFGVAGTTVMASSNMDERIAAPDLLARGDGYRGALRDPEWAQAKANDRAGAATSAPRSRQAWHELIAAMLFRERCRFVTRGSQRAAHIRRSRTGWRPPRAPTMGTIPAELYGVQAQDHASCNGRAVAKSRSTRPL